MFLRKPHNKRFRRIQQLFSLVNTLPQALPLLPPFPSGPHIGSKETGHKPVATGNRGVGDSKSKKIHCSILLILQQVSYSGHLLPSDLDSRWTDNPPLWAAEPCEVFMLHLPANVSVALCHKPFVSTSCAIRIPGKCPNSLSVKGLDCLSESPAFYRVEKNY